jgi:hypothetical protein
MSASSCRLALSCFEYSKTLRTQQEYSVSLAFHLKMGADGASDILYI